MRKYLPWRLVLANIFLIFCGTSAAYEITGEVIKVADGDTITIPESNYNKQKIRLADIDAPEKGQPYGKISKQYLGSSKHFGQSIPQFDLSEIIFHLYSFAAIVFVGLIPSYFLAKWKANKKFRKNLILTFINVIWCDA